MGFSLDDFNPAKIAADAVGDLFGHASADELAGDARAFNAEQANIQRQWQERMRGSAWQTTVGDMKAAGLNPMLAYSQGASHAGQGASASTSPGARTPTKFGTASFATAAQADQLEASARLLEAQTSKTKAEEDEVRARTPTHAVTIQKMRQEINESVERIQKIQQDVRTGASSAAHLNQQAENLREEIPKIRAAVDQLKALASLNDAQRQERYNAARLNASQAAEIDQRIKQNLPELERRLRDLTVIARQMEQPGRQADEAARASFAGTIGAYLRALLPLNSFLSELPR